MNKNLIKKKKQPNDVIYTPIELSKNCIETIEINENDFLLDPFFGDGSFFNNFPQKNNKDWCEIEKNKDFFNYNEKVDWIISNPPFSKLTNILIKCSEICNKGFGLIMLCTALTPKRINLLESKGFFIEKINLFTVKSWFGFPCFFVVFKKNGKSIFTIKSTSY